MLVENSTDNSSVAKTGIELNRPKHRLINTTNPNLSILKIFTLHNHYNTFYDFIQYLSLGLFYLKYNYYRKLGLLRSTNRTGPCKNRVLCDNIIYVIVPLEKGVIRLARQKDYVDAIPVTILIDELHVEHGLSYREIARKIGRDCSVITRLHKNPNGLCRKDIYQSLLQVDWIKYLDSKNNRVKPQDIVRKYTQSGLPLRLIAQLTKINVETLRRLQGTKCVGITREDCERLMAAIPALDEALKNNPYSSSIQTSREAANIIKGLFKKGYTPSQMAKMYGTRVTTIARIVHQARVRLCGPLAERVLATDLSNLPKPAGNIHITRTKPKARSSQGYPGGEIRVKRPDTTPPLDTHSRDPHYHARHWHDVGFSYAEIARITGISAGDVERAINGGDLGPYASSQLISKTAIFESCLID